MSFDITKYVAYKSTDLSVKGTRVVGLIADVYHEVGDFGTIDEDGSSMPTIAWDNGRRASEYISRLAPINSMSGTQEVSGQTEFLEGQYIIALHERCKGDKDFTYNFCFKQESNSYSLTACLSCVGSTSNGWDIVHFNDKGSFRFATAEEIAEYERLGKPYNVDTISKWSPASPSHMETYGLKTGDILPEKILNEWANQNKNTYYRDRKWYETNSFITDRVIEDFKVFDGRVGALVSRTANVYVAAKGLKEFIESKQGVKITPNENIQFIKTKRIEIILVD